MELLVLDPAFIHSNELGVSELDQTAIGEIIVSKDDSSSAFRDIKRFCEAIRNKPDLNENACVLAHLMSGVETITQLMMTILSIKQVIRPETIRDSLMTLGFQLLAYCCAQTGVRSVKDKTIHIPTRSGHIPEEILILNTNSFLVRWQYLFRDFPLFVLWVQYTSVCFYLKRIDQDRWICQISMRS